MFVIVALYDMVFVQLITLIAIQTIYFGFHVGVGSFEKVIEKAFKLAGEFIFILFLAMKVVDYTNFEEIKSQAPNIE